MSSNTYYAALGGDQPDHWPVAGLALVNEVDLKAGVTADPTGWGANRPYAQLADAKSVVFRSYKTGVREMDIVHADMARLTPADMLWFWRRLGHFVRVDYNGVYGKGSELSVYRLWHQRDHVRVFRAPGDRSGHDPKWVIDEGAEFRIEELILQKHHVKPDVKQVVSQFDEHNFGFSVALTLPWGKLNLGHLDHFMAPTADGSGTQFRVRMRLGRPGNPLLNAIVRRVFSDQFMRDWALHNVEESGESAKIVPKLKKLPDEAFVSRAHLETRTVQSPEPPRVR